MLTKHTIQIPSRLEPLLAEYAYAHKMTANEALARVVTLYLQAARDSDTPVRTKGKRVVHSDAYYAAKKEEAVAKAKMAVAYRATRETARYLGSSNPKEVAMWAKAQQEFGRTKQALEAAREKIVAATLQSQDQTTQ